MQEEGTMRRKVNIGFIAVLLAAVVATTGFAAGGAEEPKDKEDVTLSVLLFDRATAGFIPEGGIQAKYIQENVKKKLGYTVKFVIMPRFPDVDRVNVLMASGAAPDVSFLYSDAAVGNYVKSGGLTELKDLLDTYAPNLKKLLGDDCLSYGRFSGVQYAVPAKRTQLAKSGTFIRKDWLDKLGLGLPTTRDEWYAAVKAFKTKDPGNAGDKLIPLEIGRILVADPDWGFIPLMQSFLPRMSAEDAAVYSYSTVSKWAGPGYKEGMRFLNKMYNEGLIGTEFPLDRDGTIFNRNMTQGFIGTYMQNWDYQYRTEPGLQTELAKVVPTGLVVPIDPFKNYEGKTAKPLYNPNGLFIFVPKFSKNAVAAIRYLEWMSDPEVRSMLQSGVKGVHYTDEVNGIPTGFIDMAKVPDAQKMHFMDFCPILNGKEFGSDEKNAEAVALGSGYSPGTQPLVKQAYIYGMKDGYFPFHFESVVASDAKYNGALNQKSAEMVVQLISVTKPADFDSTYDSLVKEWLSMGGQTVIDERRAVYKAQTAAKK
jgi:putative aldouronate transport system substrate-binding protein